MRHRNTIRRLTMFITVLTTAACGGPGALEPSPIAKTSGTYIVDTSANGTALGTLVFSTTENGVVVDQVARGARIELVLNANGTTSGALVVPDVDLGGDTRESFGADLTGTWRINDGVVVLAHDADTFLRDMPLTVVGNQLEGDRTFGGVRVRLSLVRR